ncbi:SepM family pheromone-processing serine protease [Tumebacillus permanentifrigoris]|uniref:endopeptidase La n=1 Tax=Tumebacillus permanentifrigoris TaxID=378543 RepID=A0A316D973_9BACL|nr:SepM family pheromone-processing serine protease [Tumebacillus permanentifrigoris]PWK12778.1 PDZ domain-containing protein [Tumebacillus permanentifrigoris]
MSQPHDEKPRRFFSRSNLKGVILTAVIAASFLIPTPYYLYQPGTAEVLAPKVTVEGGEKDEKGNLMLTTVLSIHATNIYYLAYGYFAPNTELRKEEEVKGNLSDGEYDRLLKHMMDTSQQNAVISGFKAAGQVVDVSYDGVFVSSITANSKAAGILQVGDVITEVDGHSVNKSDEMIKYLNDNKQVGDTVTLKYTRYTKDKQEQKESKIALMDLTDPNNKQATHRVGLGVVPENEMKIKPPRDVQIHAEDIGGPSAGTMFSLEIYSQLTQGDLTKGYKIAGTGTIDATGTVGQIGGIEHKIVAADKAGADLFFAPADVGPDDTNTKVAEEQAKKIGTKMKVVSIKTMQDAIDYLQGLPEKQ